MVVLSTTPYKLYNKQQYARNGQHSVSTFVFGGFYGWTYLILLPALRLSQRRTAAEKRARVCAHASELAPISRNQRGGIIGRLFQLMNVGGKSVLCKKFSRSEILLRRSRLPAYLSYLT